MDNVTCIRDPKQDCIGHAEAALLEQRIEILERDKDAFNKFREDYQNDREETIARNIRLDMRLENIEHSLSDIANWHKEEVNRPAKFVNNVKDKTIGIVVGAIITAILAWFGINGGGGD